MTTLPPIVLQPGDSITISAAPTFVAPPPVVVPPPIVPVATVYGSGIGGDTRNNHRLDGTSLSFRFRSSGGTPHSVKVSERTGSGYSMGTGGTIRATMQSDSGGRPSGPVLASVEWAPGNPGATERWPEHVFSGGSALTAGSLYHVVFANVDPSPGSNYISLNALYTFGGAASHPIAPDLALIEGGTVQPGDLPIFDLACADGSHDGQAYIGNMIANFGVVSGAKMVRQTLAVASPMTVSAVSVRVRRSNGTSPLILRLEHGDGSAIEEVSVAAAAIPISAAGGDNGGSAWATATFSAQLAVGAYNLVLKTVADSEYTAAPLQDGITKGLLSPAYRGGGAEKTSGTSWVPLYPYTDTAVVDLQFYFVTA
jgi:hypothetical protein